MFFIKRMGLRNFILNVSRHDPVKNPKEFVLLAQAMPEYNFVIIGNGLTKELFKEHYCILLRQRIYLYLLRCLNWKFSTQLLPQVAW